jgi:hypothetical protein
VNLRHLFSACCVGLLAGFAPHDRTAPDSWALLIGVSDYIHFGDEIGGDLPGAAPDAVRMRDVLLARWGFDERRVRLVLDHDATRARILSELTDWLPAVVKPGDLVLVYFAGHGSQTWSNDPNDPTGIDQTICPTDVRKGDPSMDIRDKELGGYLRALPTENVVVVLDNCHAGTGTRAVTPHMRPRFLGRDLAADVPRSAAPVPSPPIPAARHDNILEIAAAQSHEVAVDAEWPGIDGADPVFGGAFTTHLVRNLWRVPRRTSYHTIFTRTVEDMKRDRFAQQPMIQLAGRDVGPSDGTLAFAAGGAEAGENGFVPVTGANGGLVRLGGGLAAGMTVGSIYEASGARLRVTAVEPGSATAAHESGPPPDAGTPAALVAHVYPARTLRVSVAGIAESTRAALARAVGAGSGIELVAGARDFAHLLVRPGERGGYVIIGLDGATRHQIEGSGDIAILALRNALRTETGAHQIASLDNPAQPFALDFGFTGGRSSFRLGDRIQFEARPERDGYLTIVDIGVNGDVVVLYPNDIVRDNRVRAGQRVVLPTQGMDVEFEAQEPIGRGMVRAFLTERPLELGFTVGEPEDAAAVVRALYRAAGGNSAGTGALPVRTWATASVVYTIGR